MKLKAPKCPVKAGFRGLTPSAARTILSRFFSPKYSMVIARGLKAERQSAFFGLATGLK
jgi:hypothetical protein